MRSLVLSLREWRAVRWLEAQLTPERRRFVKFGLVGSSGVVVNLLFLQLGLYVFADFELSVQASLASALGIGVSVLSNFLLNDAWTWGERQKGPRKRDFLARLGKYVIASAAAIGIQYGCAMFLVHFWTWNVHLAQLSGIAFGMTANYAANNHWTFRDPKPKP